jgi:PAS domain S-box-containing protein
MYRDCHFRGRHSNGLKRRYFDLRKGCDQLIVRLETRNSVRSHIYGESCDGPKANLEDKSFDWIHRVGASWDNQSSDTKFMPHLDWIWDRQNRVPVLLASSVIVLAIALVDWWTKPYFSLGFLYLFPIMLAAGFLPRWAIVFLGLACALLSERFSNLDPSDANIRLGFETLALCGCGLLTSEVLRNKRLSLEAQERMRVLVETSPAAIVTVDERGFIELANQAANELMAPHDGNLIGQPVAAFLPELHHALRPEEGPQFRTSMQCRGHRGNGESFLAEVWFSSYKEGTTPKLAAIIADVSEEQTVVVGSSFDQKERPSLNTRELDVLRLVVQGLANKEIASRMDISESGVKNTLQQLFGKTEVRTRSQLVRVALERYRDLL